MLYDGNEANGTVKPTHAIKTSKGTSIGVDVKKCPRFTMHHTTNSGIKMTKLFRSMDRRCLNGSDKI